MREYVKCFECGIEVEKGFEWASSQDNKNYCSECGNELQRLTMINNTLIMNAKETKIFNSIARAWKKKVEGVETNSKSARNAFSQLKHSLTKNSTCLNFCSLNKK